MTLFDRRQAGNAYKDFQEKTRSIFESNPNLTLSQFVTEIDEFLRGGEKGTNYPKQYHTLFISRLGLLQGFPILIEDQQKPGNYIDIGMDHSNNVYQTITASLALQESKNK